MAGWTILWWLTALAASLAGPRAGAVCGLLAAGAGLAGWWLKTGRRRLELAGGIAAILVGAPFVLLPPYFYDALVYHLGLPWSWLVNASFAPVPHNLFSHFPLAGETVYLLPVALGLPRAAAGLHWLTFVAALVAAAGLARDLGAGRWSWMAPAGLVACWHSLWVAGVAGVDQLVVLAAVVAARELLAREDPGWRPAAAGGTALGLALAAKYTAVLPAAGILAAMAVVRPARWRRVAGAALVAAGTASFWYLRNLLLTGNPVYPLLWELLGGRGWTAADDARWNGLVHEGVHGLGSAWGGLARLFSDGPGLGLWFAAALVVGAAALTPGRDRRRRAAILLALAFFVVLWLATSHTTRYALPMLPLAGALAAAGLAGMRPAVRTLAAAGLTLAAAYGVLFFAGFVGGTLRVQEVWLGRVSAEAWRHRVTIDDPMPGYRAAGRLLPAGARLLVVGEGRPWGCPRPHGVSSPYDTPLIQPVIEAAGSAGEAAAALRRDGFDDLFINWPELDRLRRDFGIFRLRPPAAARWRELLSAHTVRVWAADGLELRRILGGAASPAAEPDRGSP